jgi:hypothetical protein
LQSRSKALLKDKGRRGMAKEKAVGSGQVAQKHQPLFKRHFVSCKGKWQEKSG